MIETPKFVDDVQKKISELLESGPARDLERNVKAVFASVLSKMDLVTREEFDVLRELLTRTREQLARQEIRIEQLETRLANRDEAGHDEAN